MSSINNRKFIRNVGKMIEKFKIYPWKAQNLKKCKEISFTTDYIYMYKYICTKLIGY